MMLVIPSAFMLAVSVKVALVTTAKGGLGGWDGGGGAGWEVDDDIEIMGIDIERNKNTGSMQQRSILRPDNSLPPIKTRTLRRFETCTPGDTAVI